MQVSNIISQTNLSRLDVELLLAYILGKSREWLFTNPDFAVSTSALKKFRELEKMRLLGKSVAAIIGRKEFFGMDFLVDQNVLIPRPETELLVEEISKIKPRSLLDVGTGSGCIAIAVAKNLPDCRVVGSDISNPALELARQNSERLGAKVAFTQSDLLENISEDFELIAANLPYVPEDSPEIQKSVADFEPHAALFSGADGLDLIRKLLGQIAGLQNKPKHVLLEFGGEQQRGLLREIVTKTFPNARIEFKTDLASHPRMLKIEGL
ncbi:MAG: peptide chain release factor N(5)-glutamine methyltransferase [Candidatus Peribacteraceae bacterium]|nr:peptide chain release factor N(5)-glutamine methyltransferase [Candidatus Peribacteraceae bacterium]